MKISKSEEKLDAIWDKFTSVKHIKGAVIRMESGDHSFSWTKATGNLKKDSSYFIASTTKLYITAAILAMRENGDLQLKDPIANYFTDDILQNLHVYKGTNYSKEITIGQLLSNTSGLPDYFGQKREDKSTLEAQLLAGKDQSWTFNDVIAISKNMKPRFKPGEQGKAFYCDTNFQLLGKIIEMTTGKTLNEAFHHFIYHPLQLKSTYIYADSNDKNPVPLYYKSEPLHIPRAMISFKPDGAIVSNAEESMIFIKAFFTGKLFPKHFLQELYQWNKIFYPLEYGYGVTRFKLSRVFSPFKPIPEIIGHSGLSGAFAYFCPEKDVYFTGTTNQAAKPGLPYRLMMKLLYAYN